MEHSHQQSPASLAFDLSFLYHNPFSSPPPKLTKWKLPYSINAQTIIPMKLFAEMYITNPSRFGDCSTDELIHPDWLPYVTDILNSATLNNSPSLYQFIIKTGIPISNQIILLNFTTTISDWHFNPLREMSFFLFEQFLDLFLQLPPHFLIKLFTTHLTDSPQHLDLLLHHRPEWIPLLNIQCINQYWDVSNCREMERLIDENQRRIRETEELIQNSLSPETTEPNQYQSQPASTPPLHPSYPTLDSMCSNQYLYPFWHARWSPECFEYLIDSGIVDLKLLHSRCCSSFRSPSQGLTTVAIDNNQSKPPPLKKPPTWFTQLISTLFIRPHFNSKNTNWHFNFWKNTLSSLFPSHSCPYPHNHDNNSYHNNDSSNNNKETNSDFTCSPCLSRIEFDEFIFDTHLLPAVKSLSPPQVEVILQNIDIDTFMMNNSDHCSILFKQLFYPESLRDPFEKMKPHFSQILDILIKKIPGFSSSLSSFLIPGQHQYSPLQDLLLHSNMDACIILLALDKKQESSSAPSPSDPLPKATDTSNNNNTNTATTASYTLTLRSALSSKNLTIADIFSVQISHRQVRYSPLPIGQVSATLQFFHWLLHHPLLPPDQLPFLNQSSPLYKITAPAVLQDDDTIPLLICPVFSIIICSIVPSKLHPGPSILHDLIVHHKLDYMGISIPYELLITSRFDRFGYGQQIHDALIDSTCVGPCHLAICVDTEGDVLNDLISAVVDRIYQG